MKIRELWHKSPTQSAIESRDVTIYEGKLLLKSEYSLISQGTEKLVASGFIPKDLHHEMKVPHMKGSFAFPCTYGYSLVGSVTKGDHELSGKRVHVMHPHADHAVVSQADLYEIPASVPSQRALLASNMETIVNAIWDSGITAGDRVLIVGFGMIGALLTLTLNTFPGVVVNVIEKDQNRRDQGRRLHLPVISNGNKLSDGVDIAFNCSAQEEGLQECIDRTNAGGKIIEMSWYGNRSVNINLGGSFHSQRKRIIASQVSKIPEQKSAQWDFKRRKDLVFALLQNPVYDQLITQVIDFEQSPVFFDELRKGREANIGVAIKY